MSNLSTWTLDPLHTLVEFSARHLMIANVKGRFGEVQGTVTADLADPKSAQVDVIMGAASIDTRVGDRDTHLRSADFLDTDNHPTITYRSKRVEPISERQYRMVGDLTIRGTTREVPLTVEYLGQLKDPWGNDRAAFGASGIINRHDFGLNWNATLETGGVLVGSEVKISIETELVRQAAKVAEAA
jgi:polyisoprenoid-binding protein YceI